MPLRTLHRYVLPPSSTSGIASSARGTSCSGPREIVVIEHRVENIRDNVSDAASDAKAGSKLVSAIENATCSVLSASAARGRRGSVSKAQRASGGLQRIGIGRCAGS